MSMKRMENEYNGVSEEKGKNEWAMSRTEYWKKMKHGIRFEASGK
jgi:hypothetical protein